VLFAGDLVVQDEEFSAEGVSVELARSTQGGEGRRNPPAEANSREFDKKDFPEFLGPTRRRRVVGGVCLPRRPCVPALTMRRQPRIGCCRRGGRGESRR
jgi:hypothetical protein